MRENRDLKLHFINVNHGDAIIIEFPDHGSPEKAHFAVVDLGAKLGEERAFTTEYMKSLIELRKGGDHKLDYEIDFVCVTHPHDDHYGGLGRFMKEFADHVNKDNNKINSFWDCGFRTSAINYNKALKKIAQNENLTFTRVSAGSEFEFGETRITVLGPSVDLRNRFDTYGIDRNNASIVLKVKYKRSYVILAADAEFASWGKITEEFPRMRSIKFVSDAVGLAERGETADQLKCDLLKLSHHGSKHGTSLEYLERLKPKRIVIPAGSQQWYQYNAEDWKGLFPHSLINETLKVLKHSLVKNLKIYNTGEKGNLIFSYSGNWTPRIANFKEKPGTPAFRPALEVNWQ